MYPSAGLRRDALAGYAAVAFGAAAAAFERGAPSPRAPAAEMAAFAVAYRTELLYQSLLFVLSAGAFLWFLGALRSALIRAERGTARRAHTAYGAGLVWAGLQFGVQGAQAAAATMAGNGSAEAAAFGAVLAYMLSMAAYIPAGVLLLSVAAASFRYGAFPRWMGWFAGLAAAAHFVMAFGLSGNEILIPGGWLTYALYALWPLWITGVATLMVRRPRPSRRAADARPYA